MLFDFDRFGAIYDIGLGIRWDQETFAREVNRRAVVLSQLGVGRGSVVAVAHAGSALFFADLFAIWQVGAMAACLDPSLTSGEFRTVIEFARPLAVLVGESLPRVALSVPVLQLAALPPTFATRPVVDIRPDDDALMLFTSGTTGAPKGVVLSFSALQARLELNATAIGAAPLRRALVTLATHFGHGLIGNALTPLTNGGDIVLCPGGISLGDQLGSLIDEHAITFLSSVPSLWKIALGSGRAPTGESLLQVHVGSAPLSANLWSEIASWSRANVVNCYGMTEAANWIAGASSRSERIEDGLVGRPWGGVVAVLNDSGAIQQKGNGELVLQSPSLMRGYFDRPDLTAAVISDGWFRTGDYGTVDKSGQIRITGRIKDEINRAGFKVQAAELDLLLERHPDVAEACAFAVPDPITGQAIGVAIRPTKTDTIDLSSLRSWCRERIRRDAVPEHWFVVKEIPRNARGKVNRAALHRTILGQSDTANPPIEIASNNTMRQCGLPNVLEGRADEADIVRAVERAWTRVIDRRSFQANMPWRDIGGNSLGALSLLHDMERHLGRPLPLDLLRMDMTPSYLVRNILAICNTRGDRVAASQPDRQLPLVFLMTPAYGDLPALAEFRSALSEQVRFHVIQYPSLGDIGDSGFRFGSIIDAAIRQISLVNDTDACLLAGYSFGGLVAFEVARRLINAGRRVDFLALIDTRLERLNQKTTSFFAKAIAYIGKTWSRPAKFYWDGVWVTLSLLARYSSPAVLRRIDDLTRRLPGSVAVGLRVELSTLLRARAIQGWNFGPLDVPTTLFRSDIAPDTRPDLGWGTLCSRLAVRPTCGDHRSLFEPQYRAALCAQFAASVYDALESRQPVRSQHHSTGGDNQKVPN